MRAAAIIIVGLTLSMAFGGQFVGAPFYLAIALALELAHRQRTRRPTSPPADNYPTNRIPVVGPRRKRGRHG